MYSLYRTDSKGENLNGAKGGYTLNFAPGQLPPRNAFWSVTLYGLSASLLVANPPNRYLINSPMLPNLKKNSEGSLMNSIHAAGQYFL